MSTHTNHFEDNIQLVQSSGSIDRRGEGEEEGEGHTQGRSEVSLGKSEMFGLSV